MTLRIALTPARKFLHHVCRATKSCARRMEAPLGSSFPSREMSLRRGAARLAHWRNHKSKQTVTSMVVLLLFWMWPLLPGCGGTETVRSCTTATLSIALGRGVAGLGHWGLPIVFRNVGDSVCALKGYPKVVGLDPRGGSTATASEVPKGYLGGLLSSRAPLPRVTLRRGELASALLEGVSGVGSTCQGIAGDAGSIRVTPPGDQVSLVVEGSPGFIESCSPIEIHPIVPGPTGSPAPKSELG